MSGWSGSWINDRVYGSPLALTAGAVPVRSHTSPVTRTPPHDASLPPQVFCAPQIDEGANTHSLHKRVMTTLGKVSIGSDMSAHASEKMDSYHPQAGGGLGTVRVVCWGELQPTWPIQSVPNVSGL